MQTPQRMDEAAPAPAPRVAVIGMACRMPQAPDLDAFWRLLDEGRASLVELDDETLAREGVTAEQRSHPDYVKNGNIVDDIDLFAAEAFGFNLGEAELLDPQQRIFLELALAALEDAGYGAGRSALRTAVFAGSSVNTYLLSTLMRAGALDPLQARLANEKDYLSLRVGYKLDLRGPCVSIQTACSTSLVAVAAACECLRSGAADMALAGGAAISVHQRAGYLYRRGGLLSPDGRCRAFADTAAGAAPGNGAGVVLLKLLDAARRDGDHIYAVIRGAAVTNDGAAKVGFTAPGVEGQIAAIRRAQAQAGIDPASVGYVECHGAGTALGDPIEISAMAQAFGSGLPAASCAIGSVKSNIGHLDCAAGIAGFIKTVLALRRRRIPASLHFERPNPAIGLARTPFVVNTAARDWDSPGRPRIAGVSSFGLGGTNAHVVIEEAPPDACEPTREHDDEASDTTHVLTLSARKPATLPLVCARLAAHLRAHPALPLRDVAFTLACGREAHAHRVALVCDGRDAALRALDDYLAACAPANDHAPTGSRPALSPSAKDAASAASAASPASAARAAGSRGEVDGGGLTQARRDRPVLMLVGDRAGESFDAEMLRRRSEGSADFRAALSDAAAALAAAGCPETQAAFDARDWDQLARARGAELAIGVASAAFWIAQGITLHAAAGRGAGSLAAAVTAGVLELAQAARLAIARHDRLTGHASPSDVTPAQRLAAPPAAAASLTAPSRAAARRRLQLLSAHTGVWLAREEIEAGEAWTAPAAERDRLDEGLARLTGKGWLVLGAEACVRRDDHRAVGHEAASAPAGDRGTLRELARLWEAGGQVDWQMFWSGRPRRRVSLPVYPLERARYWRDATAAVRETPDERWYHAPVWTRTLAPRPDVDGGAPHDSSDAAWSSASERARPWIIAAPPAGAGERLAALLREAGRQVVIAEQGDRFQPLSDGSFRLDLTNAAQWRILFEHLRGRHGLPAECVHLGGVSASAAPAQHAPMDDSRHARQPWTTDTSRMCLSMQALFQALWSTRDALRTRIRAVGSGLALVAGDETLDPEGAMWAALCHAAVREHAGTRCQVIDVGSADPSSGAWVRPLAALLLARDAPAAAGPMLALRGRYCWRRTWQPLDLTSSASLASAASVASSASPITAASLESPPPRDRFRSGGVYLITGGLGGVGSAIARYLASTYGARLVLAGRSGLAPSADASAGAAAPGIVAEIEARGGQAMVMAADVSRPGDAERVVAAARARFGALHGVIHAAGVPGGLSLARTRLDFGAGAFPAKVAGTLALWHALRDEPLDFFALMSSTLALSGFAGMSDYCAANAFLDAFAAAQDGRARAHVVAIAWGMWQWNTWSGRTAADDALAAMRRDWGFTDDEGARAFVQAVNSGRPQIAIAKFTAFDPVEVVHRPPIDDEPADRGARAGEPRGTEADAATATPAAAPPRRTARHPRPDLDYPYAAPADGVEAEVAEVWEELLGVARIGRDDHFLDLGGNSLLAVDLMARLRSRFGVDLHVDAIFESPTVSALSRLLTAPRA